MITENGWPSCNAAGTEWTKVPGTNVSLQIQKGIPLTIMRAYAADYNAYIEPLRDADSASWTPTNSVATSNHLGGTAMDLNWNSHPFLVADAGYTPTMIATMRDLLDFYEDTMFWANDWDSPKDSMHHQLGYGTFQDQDRLRDFIARKIRPDGFSTFRRDGTPETMPGNMPGLSAETLSAAMGHRLSIDEYRELLPTFVAAMRAADCTTVNRAAMWCAQLGHESVGLFFMEEIADGSAYNGRADLGNIFPGDGPRYKGSGPIQLTGRHNFGEFSEWCHAQGYVDSPTYFVDDPDLVRDDPRWGFLAASWYWVVARPRLNMYADNGDVDSATRAINGGLNGIDDRIERWNRCLALGEALLPGDDMAFLDEKWTNWEGRELSVRDYLHWTDKYIGLTLDQLSGPQTRAAGGDPTRWAALGNRTVVEALAAIGEALKLDGFGGE